ncbi:MAG: Glucose-1-phosphate adenylyltransferase [Myxococcota bacterium]|nr:Glucose-1-phosphate adenylyltransferase [Myxococcota bacterium]
MIRDRTLAMVLAGGEGKRLLPLTLDRAKPAVPFGGRYRIIDFVLSNFVNSQIHKIKVLTQYKSNSLNQHIVRGWNLSTMLGHYIEAVPPQMNIGKEWYRGSADAIYHNLNILTDEMPDITCVFGGDHIYKMDVRQMIQFHRDTRADITVAAVPAPAAMSIHFGVIEADHNHRMIGFEEKPAAPKTMPGDPTRILASMGNYVFSTGPLMALLKDDAARPGSSHDFGKDILTRVYKELQVYVYDFATNRIPGVDAREQAYWKDVGTIESYYEASMDLIQPMPVFSLYNPDWPIYSSYLPHPPAKLVHGGGENGKRAEATDSLIAEGAIIAGGSVHRGILFPRVRVHPHAEVTDSILFENVHVGPGARVKRAIIDKNVSIPAGATVGHDHELDRKRGFVIDSAGIVVAPKGYRFPEA